MPQLKSWALLTLDRKCDRSRVAGRALQGVRQPVPLLSCAVMSASPGGRLRSEGTKYTNCKKPSRLSACEPSRLSASWCWYRPDIPTPDLVQARCDIWGLNAFMCVRCAAKFTAAGLGRHSSRALGIATLRLRARKAAQCRWALAQTWFYAGTS
jgi:hypothetical protein